MKATGFVVRLGRLGRVYIPAELRQLFGIGTGDALTVDLDGELIILKKYVHVPTCIFCAGADGIKSHHGKLVCRRCAAEAFRVFEGERGNQKC